MSSEASTAFYKGVKFWFVLLLAAAITALLWRMWRQGEAEEALRVVDRRDALDAPAGEGARGGRAEEAEGRKGLFHSKDAKTQRSERGRDSRGSEGWLQIRTRPVVPAHEGSQAAAVREGRSVIRLSRRRRHPIRISLTRAACGPSRDQRTAASRVQTSLPTSAPFDS